MSLSAICQTQKSFILDVNQSVLSWKGTYAFQFSEHSGTVKFKKGSLVTTNDHISGGSFVIDMNSITNEDYKNNEGPVNHLKNDDFFDVPNYPKARLTIRKVSYFEEDNQHKMEADLTIKGITRSIEFWATVDGTTKTMSTRFKIDRQRWGISYNNKLKNHAISDAIEFEVFLDFRNEVN
jgi:polyisoprenoid-binding protein YceI